jgi:hypothetical protein
MQFPRFPGMVQNRSQSEINAFVGAMQAAGLDPVNVATVIEFESARTWSPSKRNPTSGAVGLIQFMPETAKALGTSSSELAGMTFLQQLPFVTKHFERAGIPRLKRLVDTYAAVFWPAAIGTDPSFVIAESGSPVYDSNRSLDPKGTGKITTGDLAAVMQTVLSSAKAYGLIQVTPAPPSVIGRGAAVAIGVAAALTIGAVGWAIWRKAHP